FPSPRCAHFAPRRVLYAARRCRLCGRGRATRAPPGCREQRPSPGKRSESRRGGARADSGSGGRGTRTASLASRGCRVPGARRCGAGRGLLALDVFGALHVDLHHVLLPLTADDLIGSCDLDVLEAALALERALDLLRLGYRSDDPVEARVRLLEVELFNVV